MTEIVHSEETSESEYHGIRMGKCGPYYFPETCDDLRQKIASLYTKRIAYHILDIASIAAQVFLLIVYLLWGFLTAVVVSFSIKQPWGALFGVCTVISFMFLTDKFVKGLHKRLKIPVYRLPHPRLKTVNQRLDEYTTLAGAIFLFSVELGSHSAKILQNRSDRLGHWMPLLQKLGFQKENLQKAADKATEFTENLEDFIGKIKLVSAAAKDTHLRQSNAEILPELRKIAHELGLPDDFVDVAIKKSA